jgi:hypothetical protein
MMHCLADLLRTIDKRLRRRKDRALVQVMLKSRKQNMKDKMYDLRCGEMIGELELLNKHATVANQDTRAGAAAGPLQGV